MVRVLSGLVSGPIPCLHPGVLAFFCPTFNFYGLLFIPYPCKQLYILSGRGWIINKQLQDKMYKYWVCPVARNRTSSTTVRSQEASSLCVTFVLLPIFFFFFLNKKHLFLRVLEAAKSKSKVPADLVSSESPPSGSYGYRPTGS